MEILLSCERAHESFSCRRKIKKPHAKKIVMTKYRGICIPIYIIHRILSTTKKMLLLFRNACLWETQWRWWTPTCSVISSEMENTKEVINQIFSSFILLGLLTPLLESIKKKTHAKFKRTENFLWKPSPSN